MKKSLFSLLFLLSIGLIAMEEQVKTPLERLIEAARKDDTEQVLILVDDLGVSVDVQDEFGNTALHIASESDNEELQNALLLRGAQIIKNDEGLYPKGLEPSLLKQLNSVLGPSAYWVGKKMVEGTYYFGKGAFYLGKEAYKATSCATQHYITALKLRFAIMKPGPLSLEPAEVNSTINAVSDDEEVTIVLRANKAQAAINMLLKRDTLYTPRIGFCFSGGGARAMFATIGWLDSMNKLGLLDTALYMSGLSGSTWALNPLVASGMSLEKYKMQLSKRLVEPLIDQVKNMTPEELQGILLVFGRKYYDNQQLGPVDVYGALLAHLLLKDLPGIDNPYEYTFSQLQDNVKSAKLPFPLSTVVLGIKEKEALGLNHRPTVEVSPFTTGSHELETFIPTFAVGRGFKKGKSITAEIQDIFTPERYLSTAALATLIGATLTPLASPIAIPIMKWLKFSAPEDYAGHELPLGYFMGVFGSAFSVDMYRVLLELQNALLPEVLCPKKVESSQDTLRVLQSMLGSIISTVVKHTPYIDTLSAQQLEDYLTKNDQYGAARIRNFSYGMRRKDLSHLEELSFVDGGFQLIDDKALNIGIIPLLRRNLDVIVISDCSRDLKGAPSLRAAQQLAKELKLPFPEITKEQWDGIDTRLATLIVDHKNQDAPIIVYMPLIENPHFGDFDPQKVEFTATTNFTYSEEQANSLMNLIGQNVFDSEGLLVDAIVQAVERKEGEIEQIDVENDNNEEVGYLDVLWSYLAGDED